MYTFYLVISSSNNCYSVRIFSYFRFNLLKLITICVGIEKRNFIQMLVSLKIFVCLYLSIWTSCLGFQKQKRPVEQFKIKIKDNLDNKRHILVEMGTKLCGIHIVDHNLIAYKVVQPPNPNIGSLIRERTALSCAISWFNNAGFQIQ